jgi:uncharacterized membrane protein YfcA
MLSNELILFILTTLTSTLAGITAMGGGIILILTLPYFLPAAAIIPIHGATQFASNFSRLLLSFPDVVWRYVIQFFIGAIIGSLLVSFFLIQLTSEIMPLYIAGYLLLSLWFKPFNTLFSKIENFYVLGVLQTGLGLIVGAPGPMTVTLLYKQLNSGHIDSKNQVIATASLLMGITNANKVFVFAVIGFQYIDYSSVLLATITGAILGSIIGTKIRKHIPNHHFLPMMKILITLIAAHTLFNGLLLFI